MDLLNEEVNVEYKDVYEEQRVGYLTEQMRSLIAAQDEVGSLPEDQQEHHFSLATERSHLARDIQNICHDLCSIGEVRK